MEEKASFNQKRADTLLEQNPFLSSHHIVYALIREDIISCYLEPGSRLTEEKCASLYNTSRSTVRKVFDRLIEEGWLQRDRHRVHVSSISWEDLMALMEFRMAIEPTAARLAARSRTRSELKNLERYAEGCNTTDIHTLYINDRHFHRMVFTASHNHYLIETADCLEPIVARGKLYSSEDFGKLCVECYQEHRAIYEAIRAGDESAAHKLMFQHIKMMLDARL